MNDLPASNDPPPSSDAGAASGAAAAAAEQAAQKKQPAREPRPRVFGKYAAMIVLVPFVVYLAGLMLASYLESARAHTRVKEQTSAARHALQQFAQPEGFLETPASMTVAERTKIERLKSELNWAALWNSMLDEEVDHERVLSTAKPLLEHEPVRELPGFAQAQEELGLLVEFIELEEKGRTRQILELFYEHRKDAIDEQRAAAGQETSDADTLWSLLFPPDLSWYPALYIIVVGLSTLLMLIVSPGYFKAPFKVTWLGLLVGVAGIFVWVGIWWLDRNVIGLGEWISPKGRAAFNPYEEIRDPGFRVFFLCVRFFGLVCLVPLIEEFFLRGWLMRYIDDPDWDEVPLGTAGNLAILGAVAYGPISHPGEPLASLAWFGMMAWLYLRTKSIWDCVLAHGVTNLLLGIFVITAGYFWKYAPAWGLW